MSTAKTSDGAVQGLELASGVPFATDADRAAALRVLELLGSGDEVQAFAAFEQLMRSVRRDRLVRRAGRP